MDYEALYLEYSETADTLKAQLAYQQKMLKRINKSMEFGDIKNAGKDLAALTSSCDESTKTVSDLKRIEESANMTSYLESGEFSSQFIAECKSRSIDIVGEENTYEIFPYRLKINPQDEEVLINGKKAPGLRPSAIADLLKNDRNKLLSASFNADLFASELAVAYDLAILAGSKGKNILRPDADIYLNSLYKYMTPMRRFRKDYNTQSFAFDLARLYGSENVVLQDGRKIQFGPSRNNNRAIRILDTFGHEIFIATVRFYQD
jgi:hypothetical protein